MFFSLKKIAIELTFCTCNMTFFLFFQCLYPLSLTHYMDIYACKFNSILFLNNTFKVKSNNNFLIHVMLVRLGCFDLKEKFNIMRIDPAVKDNVRIPLLTFKSKKKWKLASWLANNVVMYGFCRFVLHLMYGWINRHERMSNLQFLYFFLGIN